MRVPRLPLLVLPLLLALGVVQAPAPLTPHLRPAAAVAPAADPQPRFPIAATFFYPYYPVATGTRSRFHPNRPQGAYDTEVLHRQVDDMLYAGQQAGIYSWFGRGTFSDQVLGYHLRAADDTTFRWAIYYEGEGPSGPSGGNPTPAQITVDLDHVYARYAKDPSYLRVGGKPVLFVWGDSGDTCSASARWRTADRANRFYVVHKHITTYRSCNPQPNGWHGYAPAVPRLQVGGSSYSISPGFHAVRDKSPRLARSVSRFTADLKRMKAAKVQWRLTTTWNEWSEGTGVESATEWNSKSRHGAYVDAMHAVLGSAPGVPSPVAGLTATQRPDGVQLSWSAAGGATGYRVFRNGCQIGTTDTLSYKDTGLANTSASYYVKSMNLRGTARRSGVAVGAAGSPAPAPAVEGGLVALPKATRIVSTVNGVGIGCAGRQRGEAVLDLPAAVPLGASSVVLAVTAFNALGTGSVQLGPVGSAPAISQVRYYSNRSSTNTTVVPIGSGKQIVMRQTGAAAHLHVDVLGYTLPGGGGGLVRDRGTILYNSSSTRVTGTTVTLPATVPADATAVQLRLFTNAAAANGTGVAFAAGAAPYGKPATTQHSYARSVMTSGSMLVPVNGADRRIAVALTSASRLFVVLEGYVSPSSARTVTSRPGLRVYTSPGRVGNTAFTLPASVPTGGVALLNLGIASASGYGGLTVAGVGSSAPPLPAVSFGPQQPQSGYALITVPPDRRVSLSFASGSSAVTYVDVVGTT